MENLSTTEQFFTRVVDKTDHSTDNLNYFLNLKNELVRFKKNIKKIHHESYFLLKSNLDKAIEQIDKVTEKNSTNQNKKKAALNAISFILFCIQLYLINYEKFETEISKKTPNNIKNVKLALKRFTSEIIKLTFGLDSRVELEDDLFLKDNLASLYIKKHRLIHESYNQIAENDTGINEQKIINSFISASTLFTINFAQILTNKNLRDFYRPIFQNVARNVDDSIQTFVTRFVAELKLAPHKLVKTVNQTVTELQTAFLPPEDVNSISYNDITRKKVFDKFKTILSEASSTLKAFNYNWLEKFFLSLGGDNSSSPDRFARTLGMNLTIEKYGLAENMPDYANAIKDINTLFERISAFNFSIRKTCLSSIEQLLRLVLADNVDISVLVTIFSFIPKQTPHLAKLYRKISKKFSALDNKNQIAFLASIVKHEAASNTIDPNFKKMALQINCEALDSDELGKFISIIEKHNYFLKTKFSRFSSIFIAREEMTGNKISKTTLSSLDNLMRQKKAEKIFQQQNQQIEQKAEVDSKKTATIIIEEQNNIISETETHLINSFENTFNLHNDNEITAILAADTDLASKEKNLKALVQKSKIKGNDLTEEELKQIRQLLVEHQKSQEERKTLAENTQTDTQQQFYALLLNKLDSTLAAMRNLSTGYFQTYDNQATGIASAAFSAIGALIPFIGSAFKGISAVLDWANQKRLMTEAKELSSITLTSTDDTVLARRFALKITELLNNHPVKNYKLVNIDPKSIINLVEHVIRKLILVLIKENTNDYETKIYTDFDSFINRCLEQLTTELPLSIIDTNSTIETFFAAKIVFKNDKEIEAEKLLKKARQKTEQIELTKTQSQEQSQLPRQTSLLKIVNQIGSDVNTLKKQKEKEKILASETSTTTNISGEPTTEEISNLRSRIDALDNKNKILERKLAETERKLQRLMQPMELQPANPDFENSVTSSSILASATNASELQATRFLLTTKNATSALSMAKNSITIPPRGDSKYEEGEILSNFIYFADKPGGIKPGFLCFLMNDEFKLEIQEIIGLRKDKIPYKNLIQTDIQDIRNIDISLFIKNRDCCLDILDQLGRNKKLPLWLVKQDYRDPNPGEDTVMIDSRDFRKTSTFKAATDLIDNKIGTRNTQKTACQRLILGENISAILESLGTAVASLFTKVHKQYLLKGKYKSGRTKFMTVSQWNYDFTDYQNRLRSGYLIKLDKNVTPTKINLSNNNGENITCFIAENGIKNFGPAKIFYLLSGAPDTAKSAGFTKDEGSSEYFGIGIDPIFCEPHVFINKLKDDGSIKLPSDFKNFSIFDDIPLSEVMKGVLILAKLRGSKLDKELIESYGFEFAATLEKIKAGDDETIFTEYKKYFQSFINDNDEYLTYLEKIKNAEKYYMDAANSILRTFQKRLFLSAQQIDLLDNLEKLCNKTMSIHKQDDEQIILNHLKKKSRDVIWQLDLVRDENGSVVKMRFYCQNKDAKKMLEEYINKTGNQITLRVSKTSDNKGIQFEIEPQYFEKVFQALAEEKIADYKNQPLASNIAREFLAKPNVSRNRLFSKRVVPNISEDDMDTGAGTGLAYQSLPAPVAALT